jgi:glucan phosphoethanolaminetransferase (alkaline phosphatase superfamily)
METVTIPKREYKKLVSKAKAYEKLAESFYQNTLNEPVEAIVSDFRKTNLYTDEFLKDLEDGLKKSSLSRNKK